MEIPDRTSPIWKNVLNNNASYDLEFLAYKMLLGRLALLYKNNPTEKVYNQCVDEACTFFSKTQHMPIAQADLKKIFL
jgi:hypothetical protein